MGSKPLSIRIATRLHKMSWWANLLKLTGNELRDKKWIFILGCYNSGTTLLDQILSTHPQIGGLNDEGVMLTDVLPRPEDFGWRRMWLECEEKIVVPPDDKERAIRIKKQWSHFLNPNREYFIEKSISNTPRLLFFEGNFSPVYFIHIVRNGYAVSEGICRKAKVMDGNPYAVDAKYPIALCAKQWQRSLEAVHQAQGQLANYIEVKYEDLTEKPDETVDRLCQFLNLESFQETFGNKKFSIHGAEQPISNLNHLNIENLSPNDISAINAVAHDQLSSYNYLIGGQ